MLVNPADLRRYSLNGLGARIWALLARGASRHTIVARLRREIGAPAAWLDLETARLSERLLAAGLIEARVA